LRIACKGKRLSQPGVEFENLAALAEGLALRDKLRGSGCFSQRNTELKLE
jgi:hypothetical protein